MSAIHIGSRRELFIDRFLIDKMENTYLKLHEPVSMGTAIKIDKPWDGGANGGNCVVQGDGKYHMYYRSMHLDVGPDPEVHNCVAVSDDGMTVLAHEIAKKIEETMEYPGQIKVNLIRESRVTDYAK